MDTSSEKVVVYDWHPIWKHPLAWLLALVSTLSGIFGLGCLVISRNWGGFFMGLIGVGLLVVAFSLPSRAKTIINLTRQTVIRETLFQNRFLYWRKIYRFDDLSGVVLDLSAGGEIDTCFVGLLLKSKRKLYITYFQANANGRPGRDAEEFAEQLSQKTGLPVRSLS